MKKRVRKIRAPEFCLSGIVVMSQATDLTQSQRFAQDMMTTGSLSPLTSAMSSNV